MHYGRKYTAAVLLGAQGEKDAGTMRRGNGVHVTLVPAAAAGGEVSGGAMAFGTLRVCRLWLSHLSDNSKYPDGNVSETWADWTQSEGQRLVC
ncbi:stress-associated endoplasmic reticulum protein 2 isoform X2 [Puntigrus tetrazona]|uniref:stress-associated endoplasmic reticulum protein 2 isoform X2 n=1 Tax=Puntigrus tetrazona TaxID=1606681 RepID=UPI001C89000F|nr:stress-associated endoplasmic reticulum protein 2 isoform X2 [Puntigrus tetrazona]